MMGEHRKMARLIGDMALGLTTLGVRASGCNMSSAGRALAELLAEILVNKTRGDKG